MRIILYQFEVLELEIKDALYLRIYLHLRKLARLTGELECHLLEVVCINVSVACGMDKFTRLQATYLSNHHGKKRI
jgi:hypothetical protein